METVSASRGGSLQNQSPSSKEWRAVSDSSEYLTDERTIYENGREADGEMLQQRVLDVSRRKGELQQLEIELRAQMIARHEIMEIRSNFESQFTDYANAASRMQEQLHEKERSIREAERKLEDKDRELHAVKLDNEAAWAKEGILREQNKELATFRRERDHSEAERSQNIHQISKLQEHIQEKERQCAELQEQNGIAQETIMYKDEQLREAQSWILRGQEMDALQLSANHSLQAELRERTEQYNQLWLGWQRQFGEMERLHVQTVQQLQLELANVKEGSVDVHSNGKSSENTSSLDDKPAQNRVDLGMHGYPQAGQKTPLHVAQIPTEGVLSDPNSEYQGTANGQPLGQGYVQSSQGAQYVCTTPSSSVSEQAVETGNGDYIGSENNFEDISSQFRDALKLDSHALNQKPEEGNGQNVTASVVPETLISSGKSERNLESGLLDERSLLACIVRTIPAGGRIRIRSTLPNRLGKMLAPLHWHDYKKKYGKLDDFVTAHAELFLIEDDYIEVREGAQKIIAASTAAAKVAAATAAMSKSPNSGVYLAMTPMAQSQGSKTVQRGRQSSDYMGKQQRNL